MTSILTNSAAVSALQTLRSISTQMLHTQQQVSTGMRVGEASDNAAYWSIATTMRSDNGALAAVQDALGLGAAQVDTAYTAMESAIDVVQEIKNKLVAATEPGVDKSKVQEEITQLQDQLKNIAASASFSGENWLQADLSGKYDAVKGINYASDDIAKRVVGNFTRDADGNVSIRTIDVTLNETNVLYDLSGGDAGILDTGPPNGVRKVKDTNGIERWSRIDTVNFYSKNVEWRELEPGIWQQASTDGVFYDGTRGTYVMEMGGAYLFTIFSTTSNEFEINTNSFVPLNGTIALAKGISVSELDITKLDDYKGYFSPNSIGLGDFATDKQVMENLIYFTDGQLEKMISAASRLGSMSMRIELQDNFVSKLSNSFTSGVGRLVDADMNEASTRLKALQTQQQLATQSLTIANSDSQNILTLFR
ncbi:flagellar hook associated protein [Rhizobium sp. XQZ8]|uniref:flagellin N-terminal helical domain-containing protein n=1 Tax=Rhizobium populisoli TaxID=2859785 RepID=UPI001CA52C49|nr:flagellin [Rhizobium populisoli]MBW6421669.1 flagellar hook associated protein [Rhizobium populisoli]